MARHSEFLQICKGFSDKLRYILDVKIGLKQQLSSDEELFLFKFYKNVREDDYYDGILNGDCDNESKNEVIF